MDLELLNRVFRNDGFENTSTGIGAPGGKGNSVRFNAETDLTDKTLEDLYHFNWLARRIVEEAPRLALMQGFGIKDEPKGKTPEIIKEYKRLAFPIEHQEGVVLRAAADARAFGGACILPITTQNMMLAPTSEVPAKIERLTVVNKAQVTIQKFDGRRPEILEITGSHPDAGRKFHVLRGIWFPGNPVIGERRAKRDYFWDDSVLQNVWSAISRYGTTWESISYMLSEASISVFTLEGLNEALASEDPEEVENRLKLISMMKALTRSVFLKTDETYERHDLSLAGFPDLISLVMLDVSGSAGYPVTVLFGREPAGMNATGESDMTQWNNQLGASQELVFKPRIESLLSQIGGGEEFQIEFPPIEKLTSVQETERRERQANADRTYVDMQKSPEGIEVVLARHEEGTLGIPLREEDVKEKETMLEHLREEALKPPPPPGAAGMLPPGTPGAPKPVTPIGKPPTAGAKRGDPGARKGPRTGAATK